jgi:hypothetical protein
MGAGGFSPRGLADDASERRADQLKAAYLLNFIKFVDWPAPAAGDVLTVCFAGGGGVHDALAIGIESKKAANHPLTLRQLESTSAAQGCNVLYVDAQSLSGGQYSQQGKLPMLTISDAKGFARTGGMIEVYTDSNRLRFSVNIDTAQKAGLRISSSLLQLAASIEHGEGK